MDEFLKAKSMITPGVAGAVTTLITATLSSQFGFPAKWICLAVSFLLGFGIFLADKDLQFVQRLIFFLLNSLIIFSVAVGTNTVGVATRPAKPAPPQFESTPAKPSPTPFFHSWFGS